MCGSDHICECSNVLTYQRLTHPVAIPPDQEIAFSTCLSVDEGQSSSKNVDDPDSYRHPRDPPLVYVFLLDLMALMARIVTGFVYTASNRETLLFTLENIFILPPEPKYSLNINVVFYLVFFWYCNLLSLVLVRLEPDSRRKKVAFRVVCFLGYSGVVVTREMTVNGPDLEKPFACLAFYLGLSLFEIWWTKRHKE